MGWWPTSPSAWPEFPVVDERVATNQASWDARVPVHLASRLYDNDTFVAGRSSLEPFEVEELGPVAGLDLVHLQCHFGQDALSWARLGARVVGLDFSEPAVEAARMLAVECDLEAEFVAADVHDAVAALGGRTFDVVYTGFGALNWLPDLARWADVVVALLRPGGLLYLAEFHPLTVVFGIDDLDVVDDYFHDPAGVTAEVEGTYTDMPDGVALRTTTWEWSHPLSEILTVLLDRGLVLERFQEHEHTLFARWPFLVEDAATHTWRMPDGHARLPLLFSLRARRPG